MASREASDGRLSQQSHSSKRQICSCSCYEWRGGPKRLSKALPPIRVLCHKVLLHNLIVTGFWQSVVVVTCTLVVENNAPCQLFFSRGSKGKAQACRKSLS